MLRDVMLVLHIAFVACWLGTTVTQIVLTPWMAKRGTDTTVSWVEATRLLGKRYYGPVGAMVAVTGVVLVTETVYDFSSGFVIVGLSAVAIGAAMGVVVFEPFMAKHVDALQRGDGGAAKKWRSNTMIAAVVDVVLLLVAILAMVKRWHA